MTTLQSDGLLLPLKLRVVEEQLFIVVPPGHQELAGHRMHGPPFGPYQPGLQVQLVLYRLIGLDEV